MSIFSAWNPSLNTEPVTVLPIISVMFTLLPRNVLTDCECAIKISMVDKVRAIESIFIERLWKSVKYDYIICMSLKTECSFINDLMITSLFAKIGEVISSCAI